MEKKKRPLDQLIGTYKSIGTANGKELFMGPKNGIYYTTESGKRYVHSGITYLDSLSETVKENLIAKKAKSDDPVVGIYVSKGEANGREVKKGKLGRYYYEASNSKTYLTERLESIRFFPTV